MIEIYGNRDGKELLVKSEQYFQEIYNRRIVWVRVVRDRQEQC